MTSDSSELYLDWLSQQIRCGYRRRGIGVYSQLLRLLMDKPFKWFVPNDDNRIRDAKDLREEFQNLSNINVAGDVSVLEIIVALSRRCAFLADGAPEGWAWQLVENLELQTFNNPLRNAQLTTIDDILDRFIWRTYEPDGTGGLFPLGFPEQDQRTVELWYQMSAYLAELPEF